MDWKNTNMPEGKLERLERLIQKRMLESKDVQFTEYLRKFRLRVGEQAQRIDLLQNELDRAYQLYLQRMEQFDNKPQNVETVEPLSDTAVPGNTVKNESETPGYFSRIEPQGMTNPANVNSQGNGSAPQPNRGVEFAIGTVLLSVVGGGFILTALVMLGMYFMNGFMKGMCLYAAAGLVLLVSELVLYKRWQKLGVVFSGIGIGGLYLVTVLNYLSLHNFSMWPAMVIVLFITLLVIVLSRTRDSAVYRVLGMIACYLCLLTIKEGIADAEFLVLTAMILVINLVYICLPLQKNRVPLGVMHMFTNLIFTYAMLWRGEKYGIGLEIRLSFILCMVVLMQVVLGTLLSYQRKQAEMGVVTSNAGISLGYGICTAFYLLFVQSGLDKIAEEKVWLCHGVTVAAVLVCTVTMLFLRRYKEKWYAFLFMNYAVIFSYGELENQAYFVCATLIILLIVKVLSLWQITSLKVQDAILTTLACCMLFYYTEYMWMGAPYNYLLLGAVIISVLFISHWQTYYEILLTFTLGIYAVQNVVPLLRLPVYVGVMFMGILAFHNVKRWKGRGIMVYNIYALLGEGICFLMLMNPVYQNAYIVYMFLLIFGLATIVLTFQEKYQMDFKQKHLILAIFLTYMALVVRTGLPIVNSILLMLIALVCVGMGFAVKKKSIRIYGLVLSLIVCGKIVLYDYWGAATLQKTILFFAVGVIALVISGIYIILEKKNNV